MKILDKVGLTFDDVLLVPRKGYVSSRFSDGNIIDIGTQLTPNIKLKIPLISANMDTVTEYKMANAMYQMGGLGIIHRFMTPQEQVTQLGNTLGDRVVCIGATSPERERLHQFMEQSHHGCEVVLLDTAHGHSQMTIEQILWLRETYPSLDIIAGNVATSDAALALIRAGAHCVKVGVGPGAMCTTRIQTGCGVPQLTAIMETREGIQKVFSQQRGKTWRPRIIADGGIRNSGDIVKALAAGADAVMLGSLLAGTTETPGETFDYGSKKKYRGMASKDFQEEWKGEARSVEGESTFVSCRGSVCDIIKGLVGGILSGMSYQGADNLNDLYENAEFIRQTPAGIKEAGAHGK